MTNTDTPLFLTKVSLPVETSMAQVALGLAIQVGELLKLDESFIHSLGLATEEAFLNAVEHFAGPKTEEEKVHIEFIIQKGDLIISIRERGIPFRFDEDDDERYSADSMETMQLPGLGTLLMNKVMDKVEHLVHGREGKETRMHKTLPPDTQLPYKPTEKQKRHNKRPTLENITVREPTDDEVAAISQLAWRCYGYSQKSFLYDHEVLQDMLNKGLFRSIIALDEDSGHAVGHVGLKYLEPDFPVPEVSSVFLDPNYRLPGVSTKLIDALHELGTKTGARGAFDSSVTTHTLSQRLSQAMGNTPCCVLFGITAEGMTAQGLTTTHQLKGSVLRHYYVLDRSPRKVFAPQRHQPVMQTIYDAMKLPREFAGTDTGALAEASSCSLIQLPEEFRAAHISVRRIGRTTFEEIAEHLRNCRNERLDAINLFLSLDDPGTPALTEQCEKIGFSFAGLMPHIHDGADRLLLQYVDIPIDMEKIRIYGEQARELFDYVRNEKERVAGL